MKTTHKTDQAIGKTRKPLYKIMLVCIAIYAIGYLLGGAFSRRPEFMQISSPRYEAFPHADNSKNTMHCLDRFDYLMDSLSKSSEGRLIRDRIIKRHPGIRDTVELLRNRLNTKK